MKKVLELEEIVSKCDTFREMEYSNAKTHEEELKACIVLADGSYLGYDFVVLNCGGRHPCAYVNVYGTKLGGKDYASIEDDYPFTCHGGITYSERNYPMNKNDTGWWLGWDYGHYGDYEGYYEDMCGNNNELKKWTTAEVVEECIDFIEQVDSVCGEKHGKVNSIGFSHHYTKMHGQTMGRLILAEETEIGKFTSEETIQYDTDGVFPLPYGKYLRLVFIGNKDIPFTTYRTDTAEHRERFCQHVGEKFEFNFKTEEKEVEK